MKAPIAGRTFARDATRGVGRWLTWLAAGVLLSFAGPAHTARAADYPPSPQPTKIQSIPADVSPSTLRGTIDNPTPVAGQRATVVGQGFNPGEDVVVEVRSVRVTLGDAVAGSDGTLSLTFAVPTTLRGDRSITLAGQSSGRVASIGVSFVAPPGTVQSDHATTVAVVIVGISGLGMVLIAGGVSLLFVSRRHFAFDAVLAGE
jgi:hypothetical protein